MGHFAGLSGPGSHWREEAVTAAACWLLTAVFGWGKRWCRAERGERERIRNSAQGSFPGKNTQIQIALLSYPASE